MHLPRTAKLRARRATAGLVGDVPVFGWHERAAQVSAIFYRYPAGAVAVTTHDRAG